MLRYHGCPSPDGETINTFRTGSGRRLRPGRPRAPEKERGLRRAAARVAVAVAAADRVALAAAHRRGVRAALGEGASSLGPQGVLARVSQQTLSLRRPGLTYASSTQQHAPLIQTGQRIPVEGWTRPSSREPTGVVRNTHS
jgi:hypothetical protein